MPPLADPFWLGFVVKMVTTAFIVVLTAAIVERAGPFLGAMVATLPVSTGPALVFLAMDHGSEFLAASAATGLPVFAANPVFIWVYAVLAQQRGTLVSVGAALLAWLCATVLIQLRGWSTVSALALNACAFAAAIVGTWPYRSAARSEKVPRRIWDIPLRAALVMGLVAAVVLAGRLLGPEAAGVTAVVPVLFTSVPLVLQPRLGGAAPAAMMANALVALIGFVVALALLSVSSVALGSALALSLALAICVGWNLIVIGARRLAQA